MRRIITFAVPASILLLASTAMGQENYEIPVATTPTPVATAGGGGGAGGGLRLAMQTRAIAGTNVLARNGFLSISPLVTPGVRVSDELFIGLGFGLDEVSDATTVFHVSPTITYDLLQNEDGALFLSGWINLGTIGSFYFGGNVAGGIRGNINDNIALGSEWGFTFSKVDLPANDLQIGFFGSLFLEASIGT